MFDVDITSKWIKLKEPRPLLLSFLLRCSTDILFVLIAKSQLISYGIPNFLIFFFIKYLSVCIKSNPALGRDLGGEALIFTEINHLILLLCTEAAVPVRLKRKTLLNCLNADSLSTVAWQQLWATRINSFHWLRILKTKGGLREWKLKAVFIIRYSRIRREWRWMWVQRGAVGEATKFRLLLG